jgi:simple sugar transport system ATP-binding protein
LDGKPDRFKSPRQAIRAGLALTPENRKTDGVIPHLSIRENISLALQARQGAAKTISRKEQEEIADKFIKLLGISTPSAEQLVMNLSGGNQQKVLLARWVAIQPRLLILDEPTRGIDIGAKVEVHRIISELAASGLGIILISSEQPQVSNDELAANSPQVFRDRAALGHFSSRGLSFHGVSTSVPNAEEPNVASTYAYSLHVQRRTKEGLGVLEKLKPEVRESPPAVLYYGVLLAAAGETNQAAKYLAAAQHSPMLPEEKALLVRAAK